MLRLHPPAFGFSRLAPLPAAAGVVVLLTACASQQDPFSGLDESERVIDASGNGAVAVETGGRPPLLVEGQRVSRAQLDRVLGEAAGRIAIEEVALHTMLQQEMRRNGLTLSPQATRNEEDLFLASLATGNDRATPGQVLRQVRQTRGLGPTRYALLLERNAMLRALVQPDVRINEADLRTAFDVRHGPRRTVRLIVLPTQRQAANLRTELSQAANLRQAFIAAARSRSTDATAASGGLTEPISAADPAYAPGIRRVVASLAPDELGPVVATDGGFALMLLEEELPADGAAFDDVADELANLLQRRQERLLMDRLARQLLTSASITAFDDSLDWAWRQRPLSGN